MLAMASTGPYFELPGVWNGVKGRGAPGFQKEKACHGDHGTVVGTVGQRGYVGCPTFPVGEGEELGS